MSLSSSVVQTLRVDFFPELSLAAGYGPRCHNGLGERFENAVVGGDRCEEERGWWVVWGAKEDREGILHLANLLLGRVRGDGERGEELESRG